MKVTRNTSTVRKQIYKTVYFGGIDMSMYSDYKCGAMTETEFHNACVRENLKEHESFEDFCKYELNPDKMCQTCIFHKYATRPEEKDICICIYDENDFNVVEETDTCDLWEDGK